jgi:DNA-binding beta-propeller fold protein YncE
MATGEGLRLSDRSALAERAALARRATILKNFVRMIPAVVILAATLNTLSCRNSSSFGTSSSGSASPTSTSTAVGSLAFVTNSNDGRVSSFTRNTSTGALKFTGQVQAGKSGPRGVVASPNGEFLYVANDVDNNIYEFSISPTKGTLTSLAKVANGNATGPDELAISSNGTLLWVTNQNGTVGWYTINPSTGLINASSGGTLGGFKIPFGIAVHPNPALTELYVSDTKTGLIQPLSYNISTGAVATNFPAVRSSDSLAIKPAAIAINSGGTALFTPDQGNGEVSSFAITTTGSLAGALTQAGAFPNISVGDAPVGIGVGTTSIAQYVFTANFGDTSVSSFVVNSTNITNLITPPVPASGYNAPKGLVVDPLNMFVYTADSGDGTVGQATLMNNTSCTSQICTNTTIPTESPANPNSGPFGITLAQ